MKRFENLTTWIILKQNENCSMVKDIINFINNTITGHKNIYKVYTIDRDSLLY